MSHKVVRILSGDDFELRENPVWCLVSESCGDSATFCDTEYFGYGASDCKYEVKFVESGGITCEKCLKKINEIKKVKLVWTTCRHCELSLGSSLMGCASVYLFRYNIKGQQFTCLSHP